MITTMIRAIEPGEGLLWPADDEKLIQVYDQVDDIDEILKHVKNKGLCIQAGGACGVWPLRLAMHFKRVITFEPHPVNFECLAFNTASVENIYAYEAALGAERKDGFLARDTTEVGNAGAFYLSDSGGIDSVNVVKIDGMNEAPDAIILDVEGSEFDALIGGIRTILKYKPVVVIEEKALPHLQEYMKARRYLETIGYNEVGRIHRDVIFKHEQ